MPRTNDTRDGTTEREPTRDARSDRPTRDAETQQPRQRTPDATSGEPVREERTGPADWLASTAVRFGLAVVGLVLLLFALGRAFGANLLGVVGDVLTTQTGMWLVVAFFALLLIGAAERGISARR